MQFRLSEGGCRWLMALMLAVMAGACSQREETDVAPADSAQVGQRAEKGKVKARKVRSKSDGNIQRTKVAQPKVKPTIDADDRDDLSPDDRETLKIVEKAMDDDDVVSLRKAAVRAQKSPTAEVRSDTVDALGWFGEKTMDELLPFMADQDPDIADSALNHWTAALGEIEDEQRRCDLVEGVMKVLTNRDALESLVVEFCNCEDLPALRSVVNLIGCDNSVAVDVAREHYEFMTGEEFTTIEAAEAWAEENCTEEDGEN